MFVHRRGLAKFICQSEGVERSRLRYLPLVEHPHPTITTAVHPSSSDRPSVLVTLQYFPFPVGREKGFCNGNGRMSRIMLLFVKGSSSSLLLCVHRDHKVYWGRGAQDGHLDFHTAPEL